MSYTINQEPKKPDIVSFKITVKSCILQAGIVILSI